MRTAAVCLSSTSNPLKRNGSGLTPAGFSFGACTTDGLKQQLRGLRSQERATPFTAIPNLGLAHGAAIASVPGTSLCASQAAGQRAQQIDEVLHPGAGTLEGIRVGDVQVTKQLLNSGLCPVNADNVAAGLFQIAAPAVVCAAGGWAALYRGLSITIIMPH